MGVNFGLNAAAILGLFLAVAGAGLFFLRSVRPELARDYDIFFAAVGLLCGIILLFNGWRLEPILEFCIFMLTGTTSFFAVESIRMRGVTTEQARRNTETVDRDRPVSRNRVYTEAKVDRIDPYDNVYDGAKPNYNSPRLRGYDDPQPRSSRRPDPRRRTSTAPDFREEPPRSRSRNRPVVDDYPERPSSFDRPDARRDSSPRPARRPAPPTDGYNDWNTQDEWDEPRTASRPTRRPPRDDRYSQPAPPPTAPKSKPAPADLADLGRSYDEPEYNYTSPTISPRDYDRDNSYNDRNDSIPGDYVVDYQPLEDSESDYSDDYDESDDNYDDSQDDYDNYDDRSDHFRDDYDDDRDRDDNSRNEYDDYRDRPERRKPINFDRYE